MLRPRHILPRLRGALKDTPIVFLQGARQTGKSTLSQSLPTDEWPARYLTLDDAAVLAAANSDPQGFARDLQTPVILDEVQRAPGLALALKLRVDRDRRPGGFLLTGSANVMLLPEISQALAGRMEILTLWPFSQGELDQTPERFVDGAFDPRPFTVLGGQPHSRRLHARLLRGGFPEASLRSSDDRRRSWFGSYVTTILQRDVRDMSNIAGLSELPRLLSLLAARSGSLLNMSELSRATAIPLSTLKRYLTLLQNTFLVQFLSAWSTNLSKRLVKSPKVILIDSGLIADLLGLDEERMRSDPGLMGRLLESFAIMELVKQATWSRTQPRLYHFRTASGHEVDVLLEAPSGQVVGVEVTRAASVSAADFKGLRALADIVGRKFLRGIILYTGREAVSFGDRLHAIPIHALWTTSVAGPGEEQSELFA